MAYLPSSSVPSFPCHYLPLCLTLCPARRFSLLVRLVTDSGLSSLSGLNLLNDIIWLRCVLIGESGVWYSRH